MKRIALSIAVALAVAGCVSEKKDATAGKSSLGVVTQGDLTVELLTDTRLETGMTPIYVKVTKVTGQPVADATVAFVPLMTMTTDMGTMSHGAPVIGPPALGTDGLYHCDVVFQMPTTASGSWSATVGVTPPAPAPETSFAFPSLTVTESGRAARFSYTDPVTSEVTKYVMSLNFEAAPQVGLNPIVVTLHDTRDNGMTFAPVDDAAFALDPQMPSMGHGSSGSVNPTIVSPGVYEGRLSFSMEGDWVTTVTVRRGDAIIAMPAFATTF